RTAGGAVPIGAERELPPVLRERPSHPPRALSELGRDGVGGAAEDLLGLGDDGPAGSVRGDTARVGAEAGRASAAGDLERGPVELAGGEARGGGPPGAVVTLPASVRAEPSGAALAGRGLIYRGPVDRAGRVSHDLDSILNRFNA